MVLDDLVASGKLDPERAMLLRPDTPPHLENAAGLGFALPGTPLWDKPPLQPADSALVRMGAQNSLDNSHLSNYRDIRGARWPLGGDDQSTTIHTIMRGAGTMASVKSLFGTISVK